MEEKVEPVGIAFIKEISVAESLQKFLGDGWAVVASPESRQEDITFYLIPKN